MRGKGESTNPDNNPYFEDEDPNIRYAILAGMPDRLTDASNKESEPSGDRVDIDAIKAQYAQYQAEIQQEPDYSPEKATELLSERLRGESDKICEKYNLGPNDEIDKISPDHPAYQEMRQLLDVIDWATIQSGDVEKISLLEDRWDDVPITDSGLTTRTVKEFDESIITTARSRYDETETYGLPSNYYSGYNLADVESYAAMTQRASANSEEVDKQQILNAIYIQKRAREIEDKPNIELSDTEVKYISKCCDASQVASSEAYCGKLMEYLSYEISRGEKSIISLSERSILCSDIYQALLHDPEMVGRMEYSQEDLDGFARNAISYTHPRPENEAIYTECIKTLESLGYDIHTEKSAAMLARSSRSIGEVLQKNGIIGEKDVDRMYDYALTHIDEIFPTILSPELIPSKDNERAQYWLKYGGAINIALSHRPEKRFVDPRFENGMVIGGYEVETKKSDYFDEKGMPTHEIFPLLYDKETAYIIPECRQYMLENIDFFKDCKSLMRPSDVTMRLVRNSFTPEAIMQLSPSFFEKMASTKDYIDMASEILSALSPEQQDSLPMPEKYKAAVILRGLNTENAMALTDFLFSQAPPDRIPVEAKTNKPKTSSDESPFGSGKMGAGYFTGGRIRFSEMDSIDVDTIRDPMKLGAVYLEREFSDITARNNAPLGAIEKFYLNLNEEERAQINCPNKIKILAELGGAFRGKINGPLVEYLWRIVGKSEDNQAIYCIDQITDEELSNRKKILNDIVDYSFQKSSKANLFSLFRNFDQETIDSLDCDEKIRALGSISHENPRQIGLIKSFIFESIPDPDNPDKKISRYDMYDATEIRKVGRILNRLNKSRSDEVLHLVTPIAERLLHSGADSEGAIDSIEFAFLRKDIPEFVKLYNCSNLLFESTIDEDDYVSPVLLESTNRRRLLMADLLKSALRSGNPSLRAYLEKMVAFKAQEEEAIENNEELPGMDKSLEKFRVKFLGYARVLGYESEKEILQDMDQYRAERSRKNIESVRQFEDGKFYLVQPIEAGDLIKGINVDHADSVMRNGYNCPEMIGSVAKQDQTPWDTDFGSCGQEYSGDISKAIDFSEAAAYGDGIWLCVRNDERFHPTAVGDSNGYDDYTKYELFQRKGKQANFRGIRTGMGSFDVDFYVIKDPDDPDYSRLRYEIAKSGCYVPIIEKATGEVIFTPDQFEELRQRASGISKYGIVSYSEDGERSTDLDTYHFAPDLSLPKQFFAEMDFDPDEITAGYDEKVEETATEQRMAMEEIIDRIERSDLPEEVKVIFRNINPPNLSDRDSMFYASTGSTGRFTNIPGDGDYDFMWRIDGNILESYGKSIMSLLDRGDNPLIHYDSADQDSKRIDLNIRKGIMRVGDRDIEIDISPRQLLNNIETSSDAVLLERLTIMEEQDPQKYREVITNILAAKTMLKKAKCYKKHSGTTHSQGGLGGVGVENWILQHGGSLVEAARAFVEAAEKGGHAGKPVDFAKFKSQYQVWDYGENYMTNDADDSGSYPYDEFVYRNMDPGGYARMYQACKELLAASAQTA